MHVRALAALAALSLAPGCLRGRGTTEEPVVTEIAFEGVRAFDGEDIAEKLATQEPVRGSGLGGFFTRVGFRLDPDALELDRRRVEAYYRAHGYYGARVGDVPIVPDGSGRAKVVFKVTEGEPVRVRTLAVNGLEEAPEAAARVRELPLRRGEVFTEGRYDASKAAIEAALATTGYATGEVTQAARILPDELAAEVTYVVRPGQRFRFGPIFVAGTSAVSRVTVREQAAREIHTGEWYDESRLGGAQARVFNLGVFAGVRVTRGEPSRERGIIPIVVAVREAPFRTLRVGPSLAIEATRWEARGVAGWTHRNLWGDLRRVDLDLRAGYAWLPTLFTRQKEGFVGQVGVAYAQPTAITRNIDLAARLELERGIEPGFDFWAQRIQLAFPLRLAPQWSVTPSYNLEVYELSDTPTITTGQQDRPLLENCPRTICLLSYLEQRLAWDGRNDPVNTRRGLHVSLAVQEGFNIGGYGYRFLRLLPEVRGFLPVSESLVLAARARVGALLPVNEVGEPPVVARFFAGGPVSMRGYNTRRLSPMVQEDGEWIPVGGNGLVDASLELRWNVSGSWGAVAFVDAANVAPPSDHPSAYAEALRDLQLAAGVGGRYATAFGPVRLDLGVRLPTELGGGVAFDHRFPAVPRYRDDVLGQCVSFTQTPVFTCQRHREPILAVQFSIGEAF